MRWRQAGEGHLSERRYVRPHHAAQEETLFYVFYSMPLEEAQFIAADELYTRGWVWHRRFKLWMIAQPGAAAAQVWDGSARGSR